MKNNFLGGWFFYITTIAIFYFSFWATFLIWYGNINDASLFFEHLKIFSWVFIVWVIIVYVHDLERYLRVRAFGELFSRFFGAYLMALVVAVVFFYFQPSLFLTPRRFLLVLSLMAFCLLFIWLIINRWLLSQYLLREIYVLNNFDGFVGVAQIFKEKIISIRFIFVDSENGVPDGSLVLVKDAVQLNNNEKKVLYSLIRRRCGLVKFRDLYEDIYQKVFLDNVNESWFIEQANLSTGLFYNGLKRVADLLIGLVMLPVFIIFYLLIMLLNYVIKDSRGPVLFVQKRVGVNGKEFSLFKFRSMKVNNLAGWTAKNDARITKLGYYLRKYRIDEIPQCLNLILGNLSLVGPRPEQVNIVLNLRNEIPYFDDRHLVKPGLTGWAQLFVYAGSVQESKIKFQYDLYYIKHRGFWLDLEIILKTFYTLIMGMGK